MISQIVNHVRWGPHTLQGLMPSNIMAALYISHSKGLLCSGGGWVDSARQVQQSLITTRFKLDVVDGLGDAVVETLVVCDGSCKRATWRTI